MKAHTFDATAAARSSVPRLRLPDFCLETPG